MKIRLPTHHLASWSFHLVLFQKLLSSSGALSPCLNSGHPSSYLILLPISSSQLDNFQTPCPLPSFQMTSFQTPLISLFIAHLLVHPTQSLSLIHFSCPPSPLPLVSFLLHSGPTLPTIHWSPFLTYVGPSFSLFYAVSLPMVEIHPKRIMVSEGVCVS